MKKIKWKTLGEICGIFKGEQLNKKDMLKIATYPVINGGTSPSGYIENYNQKENTITISQGGSAGYVNFIETKFWLGAHAFAVVPNDKVSKKYIYHFLKENQYKLENKKVGATIPNISKNDVQNFLISLPPLKKQAEIAETLDKFTELTAREAQYEYYRDMLLSEDYLNKILSKKNLIKKQLNEIAKLKRGKRLVRKELEKEGKYPVFQNSLTPLGYYNRKNNDGGKTCIISAGSAGEIFYQKKDFWAADDVFVIVSDSVLNKYLYYYLINKQNLIKTNIRKGTISRLPKEVLENLEILIPPIEIQNEIVNILDNFETLVNDIRQGLPREIELRQKQYEYYREKLLTFE